MDQAKKSPNLDLLPLRTQEILALLAQLDRRDDIQELIWLIEAYASGRLKDEGESSIHPRVTLSRPNSPGETERVRVRAFRPAPPQQVPQAGDASGH